MQPKETQPPLITEIRIHKDEKASPFMCIARGIGLAAVLVSLWILAVKPKALFG